MRDMEAMLRNTPNRVSASNSQKTRHGAALGSWKPFTPGSVIRPHDLSFKSRRAVAPTPRRRPDVGPSPARARYNDIFHQYGLDPLSQATNPRILNHFVSEMGKIYSRSVTGLTTKSQRKLGKAIRRAKMMGIIPILSGQKPLSHKNRR